MRLMFPIQNRSYSIWLQRGINNRYFFQTSASIYVNFLEKEKKKKEKEKEKKKREAKGKRKGKGKKREKLKKRKLLWKIYLTLSLVYPALLLEMFSQEKPQSVFHRDFVYLTFG